MKRIFSLVFLCMFFSSYAQDVQDTFIGFTIGESCSTSDVIRAVGERGEYLSSEKTAFYSSIKFSDVYFGGIKWDYTNFDVTKKGVLYSFSTYCSFNLDKSEEGNDLFKSLVENMQNRYTLYNNRGDDSSEYIYYKGNSDIVLMLYKREAKSKGGEKRLFVGLNYYDVSISREIQSMEQDEL